MLRRQDVRYHQRRGGVMKQSIVGVINLSPESNPDSVVANREQLLEKARDFGACGVDYIELGGRSTSPAAPLLSDEAELARVRPAFDAVKDAGFAVSIDTWSPVVAAASLDAGADIINFMGAHIPDDLARSIARSNASLVVVYMPYGDPYQLRGAAPADGRPGSILEYFKHKLEELSVIPTEQIILDPCMGLIHAAIRKNILATLKYQVRLFNALGDFRSLGCRIMMDHENGNDSQLWATLLSEAGPDLIRAHYPSIFRDLSATPIPGQPTA